MPKLLCNRRVIALLAISVLLTNTVLAKVIHSERSLYRNILVEDKGDTRCLKFNVKSNNTRQSCLFKSKPQKLVFNYTKQLLAGLLINPKPERILIIGLGGGTMSNTLHQLLPDSQIDNVEIDQSVIKVARQYFGFIENENIKTFSQDGRVFIKRALLKKQTYDWIILDAFDGDYIPEHLMTKEFLVEVKALLTEQGILTANTFSSSELYNYESATYKAVFGDFYQVVNKDNSNRIILASKSASLPKLDKQTSSLAQHEKLSHLADFFQVIGVDSRLLYKNMTSTDQHQDWPVASPVLTDQFSPANLLKIDSD